MIYSFDTSKIMSAPFRGRLAFWLYWLADRIIDRERGHIVRVSIHQNKDMSANIAIYGTRTALYKFRFYFRETSDIKK